MKKLFVAALCTGLFVPGISWAQEAFTPAAFEKIVTEDLKKDFFKETTKFGIKYDIKDTPYYVDFYSGDKFLLFLARQKIAGIELRRINEWNQRAIYSRVYLTGETTTFEVPMSFAAGVTKNIVLHYYNKFEEEYGIFKLFIEKK